MDRGERREWRRTRRLRRAAHRTTRARRRGRLGGAGLVLVLGGAGLWLASPAGLSVTGLGDLLRPRAYVEIDGRAVAVPRPERAEGRVLPPVTVGSEGEHAFLHTADGGGPVGYDPCRPVRYVVRTDGAPEGGAELIEDAVARLSAATGLLLVDVGTTDEEPVMDRPLIQPERYGPGWAPALIAWADEDEVPELEGQVAGVGGSAAVPGADGTGSWLAAGRVVIDAPDVSALLERPDGRVRARAIVVHELAHMLGLDHVDDRSELMHPETSARVDLGPGDRQGLALVGQVACEG